MPSDHYIKFYGASDDLVDVDGPDIREEFSCFEPRGWSGTQWSGILEYAGETMRVFAVYGPDGVWGFGVVQVDEDHPLPDWEVAIRHSEDCSYSTALLVAAPLGTRLHEEDF